MATQEVRVLVAKAMLRDELAKVPHRFADTWEEEAEAWLRNADSALAAIADYLRGGGEKVGEYWFAWDSETRGYAVNFADLLQFGSRSKR